jgi:hypothetical protein
MMITTIPVIVILWYRWTCLTVAIKISICHH